MDLYHGTNNYFATEIRDGRMDVKLGGGELGRGFYIGDLPHEAFNWAWHQFKREKAVVKLEFDDDEILNQRPLCLNYREACSHRNIIRENNQTRNFLFNENIVWTPVVGKNIPNFSQLKFESQNAENLANGASVQKTIF